MGTRQLRRFVIQSTARDYYFVYRRNRLEDSGKPIGREVFAMVYRKKDAVLIEKYGVRMRIYNSSEDCPQAAVAYQETEKGHAEEFIHHKSAFIYYILEGKGTWVIEGKEYDAEAGDVVIVPPGKKIYFKGKLKQICITAPAWEEASEEHVRYIEDL